MISPERVRRLAERVFESLEARCGLSAECDECGALPITASEFTAFFKALKDSGIEWVAPEAPPAPVKSAIPPAFPVKAKTA